MKTFSGRHLFPDQNQVYRIRNVVKSIYDETCEREGVENYQEFCDYINQELEMHSYKIDDAFNPALLSRLMQFGKNSTAANSLKVLEHLPLLWVTSKKYSEDDLKRIALGQPISKDDDNVLIPKQWLKDMKSTFLEAIAAIELISSPTLSSIEYSADIPQEHKFNLYAAIINHESNLSWLLGSGLITPEDIERYNNAQQVPDEILIYMLGNCELPGVVKLYFAKQRFSKVSQDI